jgi:GTPase SAR1 family protein
MIENKKIILVGPAGAGKTSIYNTYFETLNPRSVLESPLEPTRGINSGLYSLFNTKLGIFDLAGQENDIWLTSNQDVFKQSNAIICIFDATNSIESIIIFLIKIIQIKNRLKLFDCTIYAFMHKIDLVEPTYAFQKIKAIGDFFKSQYRKGEEIEIFKTSITKDFFFITYHILGDILNLLFQNGDSILAESNEIESLKDGLMIVLNLKNQTKYSREFLSSEFNIDLIEVDKLLEKLEHINLVEQFDDINFFQLTERSCYFKVGLEKEVSQLNENKFDKGIELFHVLFSFNKLNS